MFDNYRRFVVINFVLIVISWLSAGQSVSAAERHPFETQILASYETLVRDLREMGTITNKANLVPEHPFASREELEVFGELNPDLPYVTMSYLKEGTDDPENPFETVVAYPITPRKVNEILTLSLNKNGLNLQTLKKLENKDYQRTGKEGRFYRILENWLIVARDMSGLEVGQEQIEDILKSFTPQHRILRILHVSDWSERERKAFVTSAVKNSPSIFQNLKNPGMRSEFENSVLAFISQYKSVSFSVVRDTDQRKIQIRHQGIPQSKSFLASYLDQMSQGRLGGAYAC